MKKIIAIFSCVILCSLIGCSPVDTVEESMPIISTITILSEEQASPTPNPTLSEEEKENTNSYNELLSICEKYNDWSAALLIKTMYEEGRVTKDQYYKLFSISAFSDAKDYEEEFWIKIESYIGNISNVINGVGQATEEDIQNLFQDLRNSIQQGTIYIAIFDSQEKIDRVTEGITCIDNWLMQNTEEYFAAVLSFLNSDELSTGEKVLLYCYLFYNPNLPEDINYNGNKVTITDYFKNNGLENYLDTLGDDLLFFSNN